jgi:hypothetical protein
MPIGDLRLVLPTAILPDLKMAVSFFPLWLNMSLVFLVGIAVWALIVGLIFWYRNKDFTYARGATGTSGDQTTLRCPAGTTMKIGTVYLECADLDATMKQPLCDPYNNDGLTNPSNTQDIKPQVEQYCNGKNVCSFTVPPANGICSTCQNFQMVGTYTCQ